MPADVRPSAVGFSRFLGLPAAVAPGISISLGVALFVLGIEILRISGDEAPLAYALAAVLFLPLILSYAERAAELPGSGGCYHLARASGSPRRTFAAGWLLLGGYVPLAALLVQGVSRRLETGIDRLFGVEVGDAGLVTLVAVVAALHELAGSEGPRRGRTVMSWGSVLAFAGLLVWAFFQQPPGRSAAPEVQPLDHWLTAVALLGAGLWCLEPILDRRGALKRPERRLLPALVIPWATAALLGVVASLLVLRSPDLIIENWLARLSWAENRLELCYLFVGILICGAGLFRVLASGLRLALDMARDVFLPPALAAVRAERGTPFLPLVLLTAGAGLLAARLPAVPLAGAASLAFMWTAALVLWPQVRRPRRSLPERPLALPLHPLLPLLAMAGAVFLSLLLPSPTVQLGILWALLGALYFILYARDRSVGAIQRELVVDGGAEPSGAAAGQAPFRVLVATGGGDQAESLIRVGAALGRRRRGELLVLRTVPMIDQVPVAEIREAAAEKWRRLDQRVRSAVGVEAAARTLVRIAPTPAAGVLGTAAEQRVDFLVLGWPAGDGTGVGDGEPVAERVFAATSRPVAVVRGSLPAPAGRVLVATAGGPHAPVALELGEALASAAGGAVTLASVAERSRPAERSEEAVRRTLEKAATEAAVERKVVAARDAATAITEEAEAYDVLLMGASVDRLLERTVLGGFASELAAAREGLTIVVKRAERTRRFWLRRLWGLASNALPTLDVRQRAEVFAQMRLGARAGVDYYALAFLASAIAVLGLVLDSGAVIIGAMLVAPLMSPILAMGHGIVQGSVHLSRRAAASAAKGVAVALGVGAAAGLLLPLVRPTGEMLARGEPNLFDLLVALAAGAAAAWAVSRKSVAAALPGVAISVALVPPLCVSGFGLGSSNFPLASGALLLFLTNFAGIVLVSATVFLLLGFRPTRAARSQRVGRAILLAFVAILVLSIPLGFRSRSSIQARRLESRILDRIERVGGDRFRVEGVTIERREGGFVVGAKIYTYVEAPLEDLEELRRELVDEVGVPVRLRATLIDATLAETGGPVSADPAE